MPQRIKNRAKHWSKNEWTVRQHHGNLNKYLVKMKVQIIRECFSRKDLIPMFSKSTYYWHTKAMACSWKIRSIAIGGWLIVPITASKSCHQIFWIPNRRFFGRLALVFPLVTRLSEVYYPLLCCDREKFMKNMYI